MSSKVRYKQNAIYIPQQDQYVVSVHVHDFKTYAHVDGRWVAIDGGKDYFRVVGHLSLFKEGVIENYSLDSNTNNKHEINKKALWGTRGKDGKQPLTYRPICSFKRDHLRAIKRNCREYMHPILLNVVKFWLKKKYNE
jgi:hypothetical protein